MCVAIRNSQTAEQQKRHSIVGMMNSLLGINLARVFCLLLGFLLQ